MFSKTRTSGRTIRRADHWSGSSRPLYDRRVFPRKLVDVRAEMGFGYNSVLQSVIVLESSQSSLYVLCDTRPRLGSEIYVYLNHCHPGTGAKRRICYAATVHRIDEFEGHTACAVVAIIRHCEVIPEIAATEIEAKPPEPAAKAPEIEAKPPEAAMNAAEIKTQALEPAIKPLDTKPADVSTNPAELSPESPQPSTAPQTRPSFSLGIKDGQDRGTAPEGFIIMGMVRCEACGENFTIYHHPRTADMTFAGHQAYWFERFLAEEHEHGKPHDDVTELPE